MFQTFLALKWNLNPHPPLHFTVLLNPNVMRMPNYTVPTLRIVSRTLSSDPSKRMSDADLLDQITAFIFGGSDPTFLAIAWCLHMLSHHPQIQERTPMTRWKKRGAFLSGQGTAAQRRLCTRRPFGK